VITGLTSLLDTDERGGALCSGTLRVSGDPGEPLLTAVGSQSDVQLQRKWSQRTSTLAPVGLSAQVEKR